MTTSRRLVGALGALLLAGCAVSPQSEPVAIDVAVPTQASPATPSTAGPRTLTVFLVRDEHLVPAERPSSEGTAREVVDALDAGPSRDESSAGLRSAVATDSIRTATDDGEVVVVDVSDRFIETTGTDQLLAVAQLVWTVTEVSGVTRVRLTSRDGPVEVPTDRGLSATAVTREDYASVAPTAAP